jgi:alpha-glucosidase (family GH31 glycosyl hydrolase)
MPLQAAAALATLIGFAPHGNVVELKLDRGEARMVWISPSAFRFARGPGAGRQGPGTRTVEVDVQDTPGALLVRSKFLEVAIEKRGVLVRVRNRQGTELVSDLRSEGGWARQAPAGSRFYGLGPRTDGAFDLSGTRQTTDEPFLYCTAGYGEWHPHPGTYRFDFQAGGQYGIEGPAADYYFYYGPTLKQVLEEHNRVRGPAALWPAARDRFGSWDTLRAALPRIVQGAISGMIAPTFDLKPYDGAPEELRTRARQLGSLVAEVAPGREGVTGFRKQLEGFFAVYAIEAHEKGYPVWHPLPFQFPEDAECARHADEFMLGDEMLVAPVVTTGNTRRVYLPQGVWTNLETDEVFTGRQTISVNTAGLPIFARNGAIVPLDSPGGMVLHYFPKLGAEFFLIENDGADWTQIHAAPAGDEMRLEIESKAARDYEWVVHHVGRPTEAGGRWTYDAKRRQVQVRVRVGKGEDSVVNLVWR